MLIKTKSILQRQLYYGKYSIGMNYNVIVIDRNSFQDVSIFIKLIRYTPQNIDL